MPGNDMVTSQRTRLRRKRERGSVERAVVHAILDEGLVCHVGFVDDGSVVVVPTAYARVGDELFLHGAVANRTLRALAGGAPACVTVTLLDGLVLSRSAFHHSMNYRSVVLFGAGRPVAEPERKRVAVTAIVEHLVPGRSGDARPPTDAELRATAVVSFPVDEGTAKVGTGGPLEEAEDLALPVWAGVLPLRLAAGAPVADEHVPSGVEAPAYLTGYAMGPSPSSP